LRTRVQFPPPPPVNYKKARNDAGFFVCDCAFGYLLPDDDEDPAPEDELDPGVVFRSFPFLLLPGVCPEFAPWLEFFESGTVFRLLPLVLLPGVFAMPEEEEEDEDIPPEDELVGAVCASRTEAIAMLATEVAIPR
jgi:hypothetical protein